MSKINEADIDDIIQICRTHYKKEITRTEAYEILQRVLHLYESLKRSSARPRDL